MEMTTEKLSSEKQMYAEPTLQKRDHLLEVIERQTVSGGGNPYPYP